MAADARECNEDLRRFHFVLDRQRLDDAFFLFHLIKGELCISDNLNKYLGVAKVS